MISYAQNFEDVMLWRALKHVERGFYIDIGAQDPVADSVSLAFYEQGWRGVHVEPTPAYAQALRDARPDEIVVQAAVGAETALISIYEIPGTGLSTGDAHFALVHEDTGFPNVRIDVPCIRLSDLLSRWPDREVHWMKIDVEGMEGSVLRSWRPSPLRPWIVIVEATMPRSPEPSYAEWEPVILSLGYRFAYFDGLNRFYVSDAHSELLQAFKAPPNVFDAFTLSGMACNAFCDRLNSSLAQAQTQVDQLRQQRKELNDRLRDTGQDDDSRAHAAGLERRFAEQEIIVKQREQELLSQLQEVLGNAQRERESLALAQRAQLESLERAHSEHADALRGSLLARSKREQELTDQLTVGIETSRALALSQREDRERRVEAEAALEAIRSETEALAKSKLAHESESAEREARLRLEADRSRAASDRIQLELQQRLSFSTERADRSHRELIQMRERHERQVSVYLEELEQSAVRVAGLSARLFRAIHKRARERLHSRFAHLAPHPLVASLLQMQGTLNKATELIMDAPLFTRMNFQPLFAVSSEGVYRLDDFLVLHDRNFVRAAYAAILRRAPDPDGEAHYLQQVRSGESKARVLNQILCSEEARRHRTEIHGLRAHLLMTKLCQAPIVGGVVSAILFLATINTHLRDLRVLENHVIRIAEEAQALHEANMRKVQSLLK